MEGGKIVKNSTTSILRDRVFQELQYDALSAIVTEALVRAVPLNKNAVCEKDNMTNIHQYVGQTLRSMGAVDMVKSAMENTDAHGKKAYLYNILDAITEVPMDAAKRIATENANTGDIQQTISDRAFTKEEMSRLQSKADSLTIPELSRVINRKVTGVLKAEKGAYEKEQILNHELAKVVRQNNEEVQDTLNALDAPDEPEDIEDNPAGEDLENNVEDMKPDDVDTDDTADDLDEESLDSYMNMVLCKSDVRSHVSVFSKLQDLAVESILTGGYSLESELPIGVVQAMTDHSVFAMPNIAEESIDSQFDRLTVAMEAVAPTNLNEETMKTALACAIMVYTMLETLKTMNISTPALDTVKTFVTNTPKVTTPDQVSNALATRLQQQVSSIKDKVPTMNQGQLGIAFDSCTNLRNQINEVSSKYPEIKNNVGPSLEALIDTIQAKINSLAHKPAQESRYVIKQRSDNAAEFSRLANLWGSREDVREFKINVDPASEATFVNVEVRGRDGARITNASVNLQRSQLDGNLLEIVTEAVGISRLVDTFPAVSIYNTQTCRSTPIKAYTY